MLRRIHFFRARRGGSLLTLYRETISDFNGMPKWHAVVETSNLEGSGAVRTLTLQGGGPPVVEKLESLDKQTRTLSDSITSGPLPREDYLATMEVRAVGEGNCELKWSSTFEAKGAPEAEAVKIVEGIYAAGFEGLKKLHDA
jgi:mxaD protein